MADTESPRNTESLRNIESPCIKVCVVDPASALCVGCGRTVAEIAGWISFTPAERRRIMAELPRRLATLPPRKNHADVT
jgi:predicted Fe-S protein YdhL (DUF1289 family)